MERQQELPVVHLAQPGIDTPDGFELGFWDADAEGIYDGVREVFIEREADQVSCRSLDSGIARELLLELDALLKRLASCECIYLLDLLDREAPLPKGEDGLSWQAGPVDVRRT